MNLGKQIGRYTLPLGAIVAIQKRDKTGWRRWAFWIRPGYDATLTNGHVIHLTEEEKNEYAKALEWHDLTLNWLGMAKGLGLRM